MKKLWKIRMTKKTKKNKLISINRERKEEIKKRDKWIEVSEKKKTNNIRNEKIKCRTMLLGNDYFCWIIEKKKVAWKEQNDN